MIERMVDLVGIEPTTSSMPWKRAPSCATGPLLETPTRSPERLPLGKSIFAYRQAIVKPLEPLGLTSPSPGTGAVAQPQLPRAGSPANHIER